MSFERKIVSEGLVREIGARPDPVVVGTGGELVIEGQEFEVSTRGHEDHGQTIHRNFELSNIAMTARYGDGDGYNLEPSDGCAYIIRGGSSLNISLSKSQSVPSDQVPFDFSGDAKKPRTRFWKMTAIVFASVDCAVTWPANVKWSGDGQPLNPRPSGTADLFELTYIERTGEWWVNATHLAIVSEDPEEVDPDATEEPEEIDEEDGAPDPSDNQPDNTYTDPETGEEMVPTQPQAKAGILVALHSDYFSISEDCGRTWTKIRTAPDTLVQIEALGGVGTLARAAGKVYLYDASDRWNNIELKSRQSAAIPLPNGDFESGDLSEWESDGQDTPVVLDTVQPPQQSGGQYYLARDASVDVSTAQYSLSRRLNVPAGVFTVSADMLAEVSSNAILTATEILPMSTMGNFQHFDFANTGFYAGSTDTNTIKGEGTYFFVRNQFRAPTGLLYDVKWEIIRHDNYNKTITIRPRSDGHGLNFSAILANDIENIFKVSFSRNGQPVSAKGAFDIGLIAKGVDGRADDKVWVSNASIEPIKDVAMYGNTLNQFTDGQVVPIYKGLTNAGAVRVSIDDVDHFYLSLSGAYAGGTVYMTTTNYGSDEEITGQSKSIEVDADGTWQNKSLSFDTPSSTEFEINITGTKDAYFDNVSTSVRARRDEFVHAITRDVKNKRFLIAASERIYENKDGLTMYVSDCGISAPYYMEAGTAGVIVSDGINISISKSDMSDWEVIPRPADLIAADAVVVKLFALDEMYALYSDGAFINYREDGHSLIGRLEDWSDVSYSNRLKRFLTVDDNGQVSMTLDFNSMESIPDMPQTGAAGTRRILATDIGRTVGWIDGSKDIFYTDTPTGEFSVGYSLTAPIKTIQEVR